MTRKSKARYGLKRTYKINPTVKALRSALFLGLTAAAASQSALAADECIVLGSNVQCVGATNDTIDNWEIEYPDSPVDLTTVTFATSFNSVVLNGNGVDISVWGNDDLRINNLGSIIVVDDQNDAGDVGWTLYGVRADANDGGITFNNSDSGTVLVDVDTNNYWVYPWNQENNGPAVGVDLYGEDFATVTNAGLISAGNSTWDRNYGYGDMANPDAIALRVDSWGDVSVTNQAFGSIYAYSLDGDAIALDLWSGDGDITVVNNANIAATGDDWAVGILAEADEGDITITNNAGAEIRAYSEFADAWGVDARSIFGDVSVDNAGLVQVRAQDGGVGVYAETVFGDITVGNTGRIEVDAGYGTGIAAITKYGAINVSNSGTVDAWGYDQANGITAVNLSGYGDVAIANSGDIYITQENNYSNGYNGPFGLFGDASGIAVLNGIGAAKYMGPNPLTGYGDVSVANTGSIDVDADGGDASGIAVLSFGGDVSVTNSAYGDIWVGSERDDAIGVGAYALGADVSISNDGRISAYANGWWSGYGDAIGVAAGAKYGSVDVHNTGRIYAEANSGDATGIRAYATGYNGMGPLAYGDLAVGDIHIGNSGLVDVFGEDNAVGIYTVSENGTTVIDNTGLIDVTADNDDATGIRAVSQGNYNGDITVNNTAVLNGYGDLVGGIIDVFAYSDGGNYSEAVGIDVRSEGYGDIAVTNSGLVSVYSEGDNNGDAWGVRAVAGDYFSSYGTSGSITVTNSGRIDVYADEQAWGVRADTFGSYGDITVTNSGTIDVATDDDDAFGIDAATYSGYAGITVTNTGTIRVDAGEDGTGIDGSVNGYGDLIVSNSGLIEVTSEQETAYGMELDVDAEFGDYVLTVTNTGLVLVDGYGDAYGVKSENSSDGDLTITNVGTYNEVGDITGGVIVAYSQNGNADGIHAYHYGSGDIVVGNSGLIVADAPSLDSYYDGMAIGVDMHHYGSGDIRLTNSGTILAESSYGEAWGVHADTYEGTGDITINNSGDIVALGDNNDTVGIKADAGDDITIGNTGLIYAGGNSDTYGIQIDAYSGSAVSVTNALGADIVARSAYGDAYGIDVDVSMSGDLNAGASVGIINGGDILVEADDNAIGIRVNVDQGSNYTPRQYGFCDPYATCTNVYGWTYYGGVSGAPYISQASIWEAGQGGAPVTVNNSGNIDVVSWNGYAEGIVVRMSDGSYGELASITNTGVIDVYSQDDGAVGIYADNNYGDIVITNTGSFDSYGDFAGGIIAVESYDWNAGIEAHVGSGDVTVGNSGLIYTVSEAGDSNGIWTTANGGVTTISNTSTGLIVAASGDDYGTAWGIDAESGAGAVGVTNSGVVAALAEYAYGIQASSGDGDITIANSGDVYAIGGDDAWGIQASSGDGDITITNTGYVLAEAGADFAAGIYAESFSGDILVTNSGNVRAEGNYGTTGIWAYSDNGNITVNATAGFVTAISSNGSATGIYAEAGSWSSYGDVSVTNGGLITASGNSADGIYAYNNGSGDVTVTNSAAGRIVATASNGTATGISAQADSGKYGDATVVNSGSITVTSNGDWGDAYGMYVESDWAGDIGITSTGAITVTANGDYGYAVGIYAQHEDYGDINITSGSTITVNANGYDGDAVGIRAISYDGSDITITNTGSVRANANDGGWAIGIYSENFGSDNTLVSNSGNVRATSDGGEAWAIYHYGGDIGITNTASGNIFGVIQTDDGDDTFTNSGDWYATEGDNKYSDFSGGDDNVVNNTGARIFMEDSWIDMGSASAYGSNSFLNNGKVFVDGKYNVIDMGTSTSVFTNNGASLHFEDGAADDQLVIFGDFAGTGHIVVDANGNSMLADRLYIDGDVVTNTANVIDVYLDNNPSLQEMLDGAEIDIVGVSGTSSAANFNLGIVEVENDNDTLYTVSHTLNKHINYSGTNDLFSLGFEISGLTQSGVAVSSIAPAVQNLWHLGSGTMFQRQGTHGKGGGVAAGSGAKGFLNATGGAQVADYQGASGAWVRMFADNGGLTPEMGRGNFGTGGVQQFDLNSSGIEFGVGYAFNDQWTAGLLGGVSEASLKPQVGGRTKVDADTLGAYLTYTPGNGFYADFSYRSMSFDGRGNGDGFRFEGDADGYSLELGYGFKTASGLVIEPQFQYSSMDVKLDQVDYFDGDFDLTDGDSSQMRASIALRKTYQSGAGEWTPYASLGVVNETNASNDYVIGGVLTGNVDTSGNSTLLEAGATAHYGNLVFSGGVNWKDGGAYDSLFGGQVSVRFTW